MDFGDQLPCGGYQQQDKKIQKSLQQLSLQSQGIKKQKQGSCNNKCDCQCQNKECNKCQTNQQPKSAPKTNKICKKCNQSPAVLIHKNQQICKECLLKNIQYKTRLTLQNKIKVSSKSRLLVCFSGGLNSICMVQILNNIKKRYQKSPLFGELQVLHIKQQQNLPQGYAQIFEKQTGFKLTIIPIQKIYKKEGIQFSYVSNLFKQFNKNSNTVDLLTLFRDRLIVQYAKENKFDFILKGNNGQSLASQIFKYFTKGIGGNVSQLTSSESGTFEYPLRQHLQKQLQLSRISMIAQADDLSYIAHNEIDTYLSQFITALQDRYSHTAPAIVRTGQKIKSNFDVNNDKIKNCKWCELKHDRDGYLCQKCLRIKEYINNEEKWKLMPQWTRD